MYLISQHYLNLVESGQTYKLRHMHNQNRKQIIDRYVALSYINQCNLSLYKPIIIIIITYKYIVLF